MPVKAASFSRLVILLLVFLDVIGLGLISPALSPLFLQPHSIFFGPEVSLMQRGSYFGMLISLNSLGQFFSAPIWGNLSDRIGRRKVLMMAKWCMFISYLLGFWGITHHSLPWLIAYRLLFGIGAGNAAVHQAALADLSTPDTKARNFGFLGTSIGAALVVGPYLSGEISEAALNPILSNIQWLFCAAAAVAFLNISLTSTILTETLPAGASGIKRRFLNWHSLQRIQPLRPLIMGMFCFFAAWDIFYVLSPSLWMEKYDFTPGQIGRFYSFLGACAFFANTILVPGISRFGPLKVLKTLTPIWAAYMLALLLIPSPAALWFYLAPLACGTALLSVSGVTFVSQSYDAQSQGEVLGLYRSFESLAKSVPASVAAGLCAQTPQLSVLLSTALGGCAWGLFMWQHRKLRHRAKL